MRKLLFLLMGCLQLCCQVQAQDREQEAAGWFSLALKQKISKCISYRTMARFRYGDNVTSLRSWYIDGGLYWHPARNFSLSANYVYAPARVSDHYFRTYHQYYVSANNRIPVNRFWYFSNRVIFQHTSSFFLIDEGYKPYARTDVREKLLLNRRLSRSDRIYIGDEVMSTLFTENTNLRRNRFYAGINHRFTRQFSTDVFFVLQSTFHRKLNSDQFIYGITLNYKFRKMIDDD